MDWGLPASVLFVLVIALRYDPRLDGAQDRVAFAAEIRGVGWRIGMGARGSSRVSSMLELRLMPLSMTRS